MLQLFRILKSSLFTFTSVRRTKMRGAKRVIATLVSLRSTVSQDSKEAKEDYDNSALSKFPTPQLTRHREAATTLLIWDFSWISVRMYSSFCGVSRTWTSSVLRQSWCMFGCQIGRVVLYLSTNLQSPINKVFNLSKQIRIQNVMVINCET